MIIDAYAAGIVLYKPDLDRLKDSLNAITPQVKFVYCFNNGLGDNPGAINTVLHTYSNVIVIGDGQNIGIASALNALVQRAHDDGMTWILTLDQDSVVSEDTIASLAKLTSEDKVAIICPQIEDERRKNEPISHDFPPIEDIDDCITSGSFMNIDKTLSVGGFDSRLFIDLVDDEICHRIKLSGYRIIRNNSVILNHECGILAPSKYEHFWLKMGMLMHSDILQRLSHKREVNPMRLYYVTRNMVYLNRKYRKNSNPMWSTKRLIRNSISSILRGKNKIVLIKNIIIGIRDGKTMNIEY
ncbi:glycosyltransferase [Bifidobacterium sp. MA2]|uniref:Glycosyltransferase n=1 Tax=Bifidobacterium santillanense TaxID=2809028 RepID=A0ABS5UQL3_9BIFI|nr:glycosyltransferase [Bifidobacterium santillanense]MBT1173161.1 glycosyltransferase [Bifidobacterium santillanense]